MNIMYSYYFKKMAKEIYDVNEHKSRKEAIREKLENLKKTKANQKIYHELMENLS